GHVVGGWSPDGRELLVMRVLDNTTQDLLVVDTWTGVAREVTTHREDVQHVPAGWLSDGRVVEITDDGSEHLYLAALDPRTGARERIDSPDWDVELAVSSADGAVQAWSVNDDGYSKLRWRREGPIREHDPADGPIPCFVYWPRHTDGPVPAVLVPHGGPEGQSRPILTPDDLALVQRGVALVVPNIHGSTGYGRAWQVAIHKDWGGIDLRDLRAVTEWMRAQARFDRRRLAVVGGSYGGFAALTCGTQVPDVWRCPV